LNIAVARVLVKVKVKVKVKSFGGLCLCGIFGQQATSILST